MSDTRTSRRHRVEVTYLTDDELARLARVAELVDRPKAAVLRTAFRRFADEVEAGNVPVSYA
jgi:hypothetical protein